MTGRSISRPALTTIAAAMALGGCGPADQGGAGLTEWLANALLDGGPAKAEATPITVEVMSPHALWDARDGLAPAVVEVATAVGDAAPFVSTTEATPTIVPTDTPASRAIQLGAYGDVAAAERAWRRIASERDLSAVQPRYETVRVDGRDLVRLKVAVEGAVADELCRTVAASDPWCQAGR